MAKKITAATNPSVDDMRLYEITTDYLINPTSDEVLSGDYTRVELERYGLNVDDLVGRGVLEITNRVR